MDAFEQLHDPDQPTATTDTLKAVQDRARGIRRRAVRRTWLGASVAAVLLMVVGIGVASRFQRGTSDNSSCAGGVRIGGNSYVSESFNSGVFEPGDLGDVVGVVKRTEVCPERDGDASGVPVGAELRVVRGVDPGVLLAAEVDGRVEVFRSGFPPESVPVDELLMLDDVVEIGINSEFDGETRWATVLDPGQIANVVGGIRSAAAVPADWSRGDGVTLEFVRSDGLRTRTPYLVDDGLLYDRRKGLQLSRAAMTVLTRALAEAPPAPVTDGLTLTGSASTGAVHPHAQCRRDRPDLAATPGETIQVAGPRRTSITFIFISGPAIESYSVHSDQLADGIRLPDEPGRVIVELFTDSESFCSVADVIET